jgi:hypothetical protein
MFFSDAAGGLVKVGPTHVGPTAPNATPAGFAGNSKGEQWCDTSGPKPVLKTWDGVQWLASGGGGGTAGDFVPQDSPSGAAFMPAGTNAERPATALPGYTRWNKDRGYIEVYTDAVQQWNQLAYVALPPVLPADKVYSSSQAIGGVVECNNLTVNAGVTLTVEAQGVLFLVYGTATIAGTINAKGKGGLGGLSVSAVSTGTEQFAYGTVGFGPGCNANYAYSPLVYLTGSGGSAGNARAIGSGSSIAVGKGGPGGGSVAIRAVGAINISSGSLIDVSGGDPLDFSGAAGNVVVSGSGAGSGGSIIIHSDIDITTAGELRSNGGNGRTGGAAGSYFGPVGGSGGCGGAGGTVILQSGRTLTNTGTVSLIGGVAGPTVNGTVIMAGGAGGSSGGVGGAAAPTGLPTAGANGVLLYAGSPF